MMEKNEISKVIKNSLETAIRNISSKDYHQAQLALEKVLALDPVNFDAIYLSSVVAYETRFYALAAELGVIALSIEPNNLQLIKHQANTLKELKLFDRAIQVISKGIETLPSDASLFKLRGDFYLDQECHEKALLDFNQAALLGLNSPAIFNSMGATLAAMSNYEQAIVNYKKAIILKKDNDLAYSNMSLSYRSLSQYENAEESIRKAILINPTQAVFYLNLSTILNDQNKFDEAAASLEKALEIKPDYPDALYNLGLLDLSRGNFKKGWPEYEYRWQVKTFDSQRFQIDKPLLEQNQQTEYLFIYGEQGLGDQILHCSMLQNIKDIAKNTYVLVDKRLVPLLKRSLPDILFVEQSEKIGQVDSHLPLASLGKFFIQDAHDFFKLSKSFLIADSTKAKKLRDFLIGEKTLLCGVSWKSKTKKIGESKSLNLEDFLPLFKLPNIQFVNLQYGNVQEELKQFEDKYGIRVLQCESVDNMQDIDGLASLIDACDFVVTSSNTTTHIVGGLGKECYLMTPCNAGSLWYWGNVKDGKSLWYPSIQIFKQPGLNNWAGAMNLIVDQIRQKYLA